MAEAPAVPRPRGNGGEPLPDHVTTPLLALITQRSLDADYEHAAARRRSTGEDAPLGPQGRPAPRRTTGLVLVVVAFAVLVTVAAVQTSRDASASDASRESLIQQVNLRRHRLSVLQQQLHRAEAQVLSLQRKVNAIATEKQATEARLSRIAARTGFGAVRGPGVKVTVNSAPDSAGSDLVRDSDLTLLTDGLWAAGAEAISVNDQRLTVLSAFRNVGIGILVNDQPINPPYVFSVIGNPDTLGANLLSSAIGDKWYALKDSLGFRFDVHDGGTMTLPAAPPEKLRSVQVAGPDTGHTRTQGDSAP
jgi:uncharacterized protein YlxW (UPF0749 family)